MSKAKLERLGKLPVSLMVHRHASWHLVAMNDPDCDSEAECEDDDVPLPGSIPRWKMEELMDDAEERSDEDSWGHLSSPNENENPQRSSLPSNKTRPTQLRH